MEVNINRAGQHQQTLGVYVAAGGGQRAGLGHSGDLAVLDAKIGYERAIFRYNCAAANSEIKHTNSLYILAC
jgi:hypothetical protein